MLLIRQSLLIDFQTHPSRSVYPQTYLCYKDLTFTLDIFGCIVQYPNNSGSIEDYREFTEQADRKSVV